MAKMKMTLVFDYEDITPEQLLETMRKQIKAERATLNTPMQNPVLGTYRVLSETVEVYSEFEDMDPVVLVAADEPMPFNAETIRDKTQCAINIIVENC